jgi:hypothetical protein
MSVQSVQRVPAYTWNLSNSRVIVRARACRLTQTRVFHSAQFNHAFLETANFRPLFHLPFLIDYESPYQG